MKKKKFLCLFLAFFVFVFSVNTEDTYAKTKYGFTYDTSVYNVSWASYESVNVYSDVGTKLGTMSYLAGVARDKGSNDYVVMFKEVMTPNKTKVKVSSSTYGYGMSEYVSINVTLPTLDDYSPKNDPSTDSVTLEVGASKEGPEISASYTIEHNDLDITSKCNTSSKKYHIVYDYKPNIANPVASNKYLAYESVQLGEAQFEKAASSSSATKTTVSFKVNYQARFGAASNSACSPWCVYMNYVESASKSRSYSFTMNKY